MSVFECVERRLEVYLGFLETMVRVESYTPDKENVDRLGSVIRKFALDHGFNVRVHSFEKAGNGLVVTLNEGASLPPIAFTGHMDTVHPKGSWGTDLIRKDGDLMYGPGAYDMKGGLATGLLVMQALADCGYRKREIRFIMIPDEELSEGLSGDAGKDFIRENSRGCAAALTLESGTENSITVGRKASIRYSVDVYGKAAHAGEHYADGISAIKEAGMKICAIEEASDPNENTYNCGLIRGGISPNTVPGKCSFTLYNRYWKPEQRQVVRDYVEGILGRSFIPGTRCEWRIVGERPPMDATPGNIALADYLISVAEKYNLEHPKAKRLSSGSDAVYTCQAGAPSVCSMGMTGSGAHQMDEHVSMSSLSRRAKWIAAAIAEMPDDFLKQGE
ncbi:MAG: M20/M25/M40 family metallo-hydrolase [Spirochaetales bacterium]|nr:M20/M25/M40 family metallo-hydrolase [Spirochaetales bacterium]